MDVLTFAGLLTLFIWVVQPWTDRAPWTLVIVVVALAVAVVGPGRHGVSWKTRGLRLDNFFPALLVYGAASLVYAGLLVGWHWKWVGQEEVTWPGLYYPIVFVAWGFLQQFCLLSFLFVRLRQILSREVLAIVASAGLFAFFHLPNPWLTLYTLGGGIVGAALFTRFPNVLAAGLAHALTSGLVNVLLPRAVTGGMKVGPGYWG